MIASTFKISHEITSAAFVSHGSWCETMPLLRVIPVYPV